MTRHHRNPLGRAAIALSALLLSVYPAAGHARDTASATGAAQAEVVQPLRAIPLSDLSFGLVSVGPSRGGLVRVAADGSSPAHVGTERLQCEGAQSCVPHPASFQVIGEANRVYRVSLPGTVTARGVTTGAELPVGDLRMRSENHPGVADGGRLDESGQDRFFVGGTLEVPAGTPSDIFQARLPVTIFYN